MNIDFFCSPSRNSDPSRYHSLKSNGLWEWANAITAAHWANDCLAPTYDAPHGKNPAIQPATQASSYEYGRCAASRQNNPAPCAQYSRLLLLQIQYHPDLSLTLCSCPWHPPHPSYLQLLGTSTPLLRVHLNILLTIIPLYLIMSTSSWALSDVVCLLSLPSSPNLLLSTVRSSRRIGTIATSIKKGELCGPDDRCLEWWMILIARRTCGQHRCSFPLIPRWTDSILTTVHSKLKSCLPEPWKVLLSCKVEAPCDGHNPFRDEQTKQRYSL